MGTALTAMNAVLPLIYLSLFIDYGITFFNRVHSHPRKLWIGGVLCFHTAFLVLRGARIGHPPLTTTVELLSVMALSTALVYWIIELRTSERRTGIFVFALVFTFQYISSLFLAHAVALPEPVSAAARSPWFRIHVIPAVLAYTGLSISAIYGLLHVIARRNLKRGRFGLMFDHLPPLERLGKMAWHALLLGFAFLTLVLMTGPFTFHSGAVGGITALGPKVAVKILLGLAAWAIYTLAIVGKLLGQWSISRVSGIAMNGFVVIVALLIVSALLS